MVITFDGKKFLFTIFFRTKISKFFTGNFSGVVNDDLDFEYGSGTHANGGCSITLKGQFWYLGGFQAKRQVTQIFKVSLNQIVIKASKIIGCTLVGQADLPFTFDRGSCNTFKVPDEKALMCFDQSSRKMCRM